MKPPKDISKKLFLIILISLIVIRIIMVLFVMNDMPLHYGKGGQAMYFNLAESINRFELIKSDDTLGFPLFLAPFIYFTGAEGPEGIEKPMLITYAFILFSFSIILVGLIAKKVFRSRLMAGITAGIFTLYPYIFYLFFHNLGPYYDGVSRGILNFQHINWLLPFTDPLSGFLVYLSFFLFFIELSKDNPRKSILMLLGILSGFSALVRIGNLLIIGIFVLGWLLRKKLKEAILMAGFSFFALLPQFVYNYIFLGAPWKFGYEIHFQSGFGQGILSAFSPSRWTYILERAYFYIPAFVYLLPVLIFLFILGARYLWRKNKITSLIIVFWFFAYLIFYGSFRFGGVQGRFFIPAIPPLIMLIVASLFYISHAVFNYYSKSRYQRR